ncbi:BRCA1 BRCA2-containing complex, subunit 3 [Homalodisca vitripennis]|nr:BRCA1 BRCA2-containing complex, subunit 3 [Homalodisca vitripennis]
MALAEVYLTNDVYMACLQLALSTEKEEVICLLLGETKEDKGKKTVYIYSMKIPHRLDKKKDRVEISIDQLLATRDYAEKLSQQLKKEVTVIGWFHSHPHITVWPSHVGEAFIKFFDHSTFHFISHVIPHQLNQTISPTTSIVYGSMVNIKISDYRSNRRNVLHINTG